MQQMHGGHEMKKLYIGMDVHKESVEIAGLTEGMRSPEFQKSLPYSEKKIGEYLKKLGSDHAVVACYEAGCMGFSLKRYLEKKGIECHVVAPGLIPRKPSERVKTDRRDALKLAAGLRSGDLEPIFVPTPEYEAIRDFLRAREDLRLDIIREKHRLSKFLLRHNFIYSGKQWTLAHGKWLKELQFQYPSHRAVFAMHYYRIQESQERLVQMDRQIEEIAACEPFVAPVARLRCFRGIDTLTALNFVVEIGDFRRFPTAGNFMAFLGMVPSEHSSGNRVVRGSITKSGNTHLRRLLIEAAWHYRHQPTVGRRLSERRTGQPVEIIAFADKAMRRLNQKYKKMLGRNKPASTTATAVGRELAGFIWGTMVGKVA